MKQILLLTIMTFTSLAFSYGGDRTQNGGDPCEKRIQPLQDELKSWLTRYDEETLNLPIDVNHAYYQKEMTKALNGMKINCYLPKHDKEVSIGKSEKTCTNTVFEDNSSLLECNIRKVKETSDEELLTLMHHEAAGIAGFETNNGDEKSDYFITNQLHPYYTKITITKMAIRPMPFQCGERVKSKFFKTKDYKITEMCLGETFINLDAVSLDRLYGMIVSTQIDDEDKQVVMVSYDNGKTHEVLNKKIFKLSSLNKRCSEIFGLKLCVGDQVLLNESGFSYNEIPEYDDKGSFVSFGQSESFFKSFYYQSHNYRDYGNHSEQKYIKLKISGFIPLMDGKNIVQSALFITENHKIIKTPAFHLDKGKVPGFENLSFNSEIENIFGGKDKIINYRSYDKSYLVYFGDEDKVFALPKSRLHFRLYGELNTKIETFDSGLDWYDRLFSTSNKESHIKSLKKEHRERILERCKRVYFGKNDSVAISDVQIDVVSYSSKKVYYKYGPGPGQVYYVKSFLPNYHVDAQLSFTATCSYIK